MNLTEYLTRARALLQDADSLNYTDDELTAALRIALDEYRNARPRLVSTTVLITAANTIPAPDGQVLALRHLDANGDLDDVIRSWEQDSDGVRLLSTTADIEPGDSVRIWYTDPNGYTIDGLDSATETTIPREHENYIIVGLCTRAAYAEQTDRGEIVDESRLNRTARDLGLTWRSFLRRLKTSPYNIPSNNGIAGFYDRLDI